MLALAFLPTCASAQAPAPDSRPAEPKPAFDSYQTFYLTNLTQQSDANDVQTALRNLLPRAKLYYVLSQNALSMRGTAEDIQLAQKILADLDRTKKIYRLTYTITDTDGGKRVGSRQYTLIIASGQKTELKQGNRVPVFIGTNDARNTTKGVDVQYVGAQVQYVDLGLYIDASLDAYSDGVRLRTKVEQSSLSEDKSGVGTQDPVISQTVLEGTSTLAPGNPLILGSLDLPGTSKKQEIEVVAELVR
jgi:type II secretory pathway component GspD/PulD (secretin)